MNIARIKIYSTHHTNSRSGYTRKLFIISDNLPCDYVYTFIEKYKNQSKEDVAIEN